MGKYDDIIGMPHHVSATRSHMSMHDRAAQFSPFAALVGFDDCVNEAARLTDKKAELSEDKINELNSKLNILKDNADKKPFIFAEYFLPDKKKSGGEYVTAVGNFRRIDELSDELIMTNGISISLSDIYNIEGEIFDDAAKFED